MSLTPVKMGLLLAACLLLMGMAACRGAPGPGAAETAEHGPGGAAEVASEPAPDVGPTPRPTPTPRPPTTPVPATPVPASPGAGSAAGSIPAPAVPTAAEPPGMDENNGHANDQDQEAAEQAEPTPQPTAVPTPTPRFQPVQPPELVDLPGGAGGSPIFKFSSGPRIQNDVLTLSGYITDRPDLAKARWTVQVWQSEYPVDLTSDCSTEKPVAFLMPPTGSGNQFVPAATPYEYAYCIQDQGYRRTVNVPWIRASSWSLEERGGRRKIHDPFHWDFVLRADLNDDRVKKLEYLRPEGWTLFIWAGETLIAREWVPW